MCVCGGGGGGGGGEGCNRLQPWTFSINISIQPRTYLPGGGGRFTFLDLVVIEVLMRHYNQ